MGLLTHPKDELKMAACGFIYREAFGDLLRLGEIIPILIKHDHLRLTEYIRDTMQLLQFWHTHPSMASIIYMIENGRKQTAILWAKKGHITIFSEDWTNVLEAKWASTDLLDVLYETGTLPPKITLASWKGYPISNVMWLSSKRIYPER